MRTMRTRPVDLARQTAREIGGRFGRELRISRMTVGLSQRRVGERAGVSQSVVSRVERGIVVPSLALMARLSVAAGSRLSVKLYPGDGISLRDSGQLTYAEAVRVELHPSSRVTLEVPVGTGDDRRAGDMLIEIVLQAALMEIETGLYDWQGQTRSAQLKRAALAERLGRPVRLILAVADTAGNRRAAAAHADLIAAAFPIASRAAWAALRSGQPLDGDAVIWVRRPPIAQRERRDAPGAYNAA